MTVLKFIFRNLYYFRRQNLAVMAATIISTAVLTGALIIGDSIRFTLRNMVDLRLGKIHYAMQTGDRFVRNQLAYELSDKLGTMASPVLSVQTIAINPENNSRINKANLYGIDSSFGAFFENEIAPVEKDEVLININTAQKLNLKPGNEILLRIQKAEIIPINTPFSSVENPSVSQRFVIKGIISREQSGRFSLKSNQAEPFNIYISKKALENKLELDGLANLILLGENDSNDLDTGKINQAFHELWQLKELGLNIKSIGIPGQFELVSDRIFMEDWISENINNRSSVPVLTYLVNSLRIGNRETPYSFVTATSDAITGQKLKEKEMVINQWLADDLQAKPGDSIEISYYIIGPLRHLSETKERFLVKGIMPMVVSESQKSLMPDFPGMSNAGHCSEWETGVPIDLDKIRDKDEKYWDTYKGTPKAYISIDYGQKIWQNQFGSLTALRFDSAVYSPQKLTEELTTLLKPVDFGLSFQPVYEQGVGATLNAVDFGELFLSLSFFVIVSGILLTVMVHVLNARSRSTETGVLAGLGFSRNLIMSIKLTESLLILIPAGILGAFAGIAYNYLIMAGINTVWNSVVHTRMIEVLIDPKSLLIGGIAGIFISFVSIWWATRKQVKQEVALAVKKDYRESGKSWKKSRFLAYLFLIPALFLVIWVILTSPQSASSFFLISGALVLSGLLILLSNYLRYSGKNSKKQVLNTGDLVLKNIGRNKARSMASITLLALGAFVIIITGANRKTSFETEMKNSSGTGGYLFWGETAIPLAYNLNTKDGRDKSGFSEDNLPEGSSFSQFYSLDGDDASCLNLNQVEKPGILGVNAKEFARRGSFSFAKVQQGLDPDKMWEELYKPHEKKLIPAIADQTVLTWGLMKSVGDTLVYLNEKGDYIKLLIIGGLNNSIFQGNLLIADSIFLDQFPSSGGSKIMLVDGPGDKEKEISEILTNTFIDFGLEITTAKARLLAFNSVTNTYLSVFMALGGLAMLIGTAGLGIVLLRNIQERKAELALMLALGFTRKGIFGLLIKENLFILISGLLVGIIAALLGILPDMLSPSFEFPWIFFCLLILAILGNGFLWIYFPLKSAIKSNLTGVLKEE
jgi:putative ABC transport system permease protein